MTKGLSDAHDRKPKALTDFAIMNLKPGPSRREVSDPGARGLYVVVQPSGAKSFAVRYRFGGEPRKLTLTPGISLAAARKEAAAALYEVEQGRDPSAAKRSAKAARRLAAENTFEAIATEYLKLVCGMKVDKDGNAAFDVSRLRSGADRNATLKRLVYPTLGDKPVTEIKRSDIIRLLDKIDAGELKNGTGRRSTAALSWPIGRSRSFARY
jgi:Arm DNA-binding domain